MTAWDCLYKPQNNLTLDYVHPHLSYCIERFQYVTPVVLVVITHNYVFNTF